MTVKNLDSIFNPKSVALIGISDKENSLGSLVYKNLTDAGFKGDIFPVNPKRDEIYGRKCYHSVTEAPKTPDLAIIMIGARFVPATIRQCGEKGVNGVIILSAGFKEAGDNGKIIEAQLEAEFAKFPDMRIVGPNCIGVVVPKFNLNASFVTGTPDDGHVAFLSQSGALCTSVLDWAYKNKIGFSYFVSIGNSLDVNFGDLIDYLENDPNTKSIVLYVESVVMAREFMSAARSVSRKKPILVYKSGRFPESAKAAASHTGAMASEDSIYDALFERAGVARVYDFGDIFYFTDLVGRSKMPKGDRLAIVTNAGGPGVMATDSLIEHKGKLVKLSEGTMKKLNDYLPPFWSHGNPIDVLGDASAECFAETTRIVLEDENVDAVLVLLTPQAMTKPTEIADAISKMSVNTDKAIMAAWLGGELMQKGIEKFHEAGISNFEAPEQAIKAFMTLSNYTKNLEKIYEVPKEVNITYKKDRKELRKHYIKDVFTKEPILSEDQSKMLFSDYGIPTTRPIPAANAKQAVDIAEKEGYPVVLKIYSPDITHKSDVGGVALNLNNAEQVTDAFNKMMKTVAERRPDAKIEGATVQRMVNTKGGIELIVGAKKDATFGTVLLAGMGGTSAELFKDKTLQFPPLNENLARKMIESLKIYPLLKGWRGDTPKNVDKLVEVMMRLSQMVSDYPEIKELDINPLIVTPEDAIALDARIVVDEKVMTNPIPEFSHLIIAPCPEGLDKEAKLNNGTSVTLRPIKAEDEPKWIEMLKDSSSKIKNFESHLIASPYCAIDYNREIAVVAESDGKFLGVTRKGINANAEKENPSICIANSVKDTDIKEILSKYLNEIA